MNGLMIAIENRVWSCFFFNRQFEWISDVTILIRSEY